eukprot:3432134-Ditylum_brightwellii.AAC.1
MLQDLERTIRHIALLYGFYLDEDEKIRKVKRVIQAKKKKAKGPTKMSIKYDIEVQWNAKHAIKLDKKNSNIMWQDAMALEVCALNELECFEFRDEGNYPKGNYQQTTLHM